MFLCCLSCVREGKRMRVKFKTSTDFCSDCSYQVTCPDLLIGSSEKSTECVRVLGVIKNSNATGHCDLRVLICHHTGASSFFFFFFSASARIKLRIYDIYIEYYEEYLLLLSANLERISFLWEPFIKLIIKISVCLRLHKNVACEQQDALHVISVNVRVLVARGDVSFAITSWL